MQGSPTTRKRPLPASSTGIVKPASKRTPINYTSHRSSSAAVFRAATRTTNTARTNTARTRTATRTQTARYEDAFVIAVIDNNVKDVGLCAYNLSGFDVELRQFSDSNTYAKLLTMLCVFAPVEIILSLSSAGGLLDQAIQACPHLTNVKRTFIGRTYFNETCGALVAEKLTNQPCPQLKRLGESSCYLSLACCGALIRYIEHVEDLSFAPSSLRIRYRPNFGNLFLDMSTMEGLEVVANARAGIGVATKISKACLLQVIDHTKTRAGKRFLRRALLEPSSDLPTIFMRQDAVEELADSEEMYFAIGAVLSCFPDLERSMACLLARENARLRAAGIAKPQEKSDEEGEEASHHAPEEKEPAKLLKPLGNQVVGTPPPSVCLIQHVLNIKAALEAVAPMLQAIEGAQTSLLKAVAESLRRPALLSLQEEIADVIDPDALPAKEAKRMRMQGVFAIKNGRNGRLDVSRKTLSENIEDMQSIAEEVKKKYGLHKLQLCMHMKRGYHFTIHKKFLELKDFPDEFIQIDIGKKIYRFSSVELRQLNSRYQDTLQEIWRLTEVELGDLLNEIFEADFLLAVHQLCDSVAILDCLTSFVTYSSLCPTSTQRAKLTEGGPIALQQAYHPTLAHVKPQSTVPNDIFLDETSALHIVTGRNQSGKSTYLRTIGLICVLAHTGCPVPAKFASVRLLNRICTRFNTGDDISQLQSHFSKEMHDVAALFEGLQGDKGQPRRDQPITPHREGATIYPDTLVLIDELGRSTSTVDGFAIALAIAEKLAAWPNVLTLFATHFLGFGALQSVNPEIKNFHLSSTTATATAGQQSSYQDGDPDIKFNYTVVEGISEDKCYGIETARLAGIPREVVEDAEDLQKQVPTRRIGNPGDFSATNFQLTEREKEQIRKTSSIISIAQRLNLIRASTTNAPERRRLLCEFQEKLKGASRRSKSENG